MTYMNTTIQRSNVTGMYLASIQTRDRISGGTYFEQVQADTLEGIKKLIKYYTEV